MQGKCRNAVVAFRDISRNRRETGKTKIQKKTKSMVFLTCELTTAKKIVATASGVWKILKKLPGAGPGG